MMSKLKRSLAALASIRHHKAAADVSLAAEYDRLKARYADPKSLPQYGFKCYSQNDEDGIIAEIFRRIGTTDRQFIELGCGSGLENNTAALLREGWGGLWVDGNEQHIARIQKAHGNVHRLSVLKAFIKCDNVDALISEHYAGEIDLFSIDLDGNDAHILRTINCVAPRVIIVEYNAKWMPHVDWVMPYNPSHSWGRDDYFGASLKHFEKLLAARGYKLVGCSLAGCNAFFVRGDLADDKFLAPFTAEHHYQPSRPYFASLHPGHPPSFRTAL